MLLFRRSLPLSYPFFWYFFTYIWKIVGICRLKINRNVTITLVVFFEEAASEPQSCWIESTVEKLLGWVERSAILSAEEIMMRMQLNELWGKSVQKASLVLTCKNLVYYKSRVKESHHILKAFLVDKGTPGRTTGLKIYYSHKTLPVYLLNGGEALLLVVDNSQAKVRMLYLMTVETIFMTQSCSHAIVLLGREVCKKSWI